MKCEGRGGGRSKTIQSPQGRFFFFFLRFLPCYLANCWGGDYCEYRGTHYCRCPAENVAGLGGASGSPGGDRWIGSQDIKETKSRGLGQGCYGETASASPSVACLAVLGTLHPGDLGSILSTTGHVGLDEEQLGNGTGLSGQEETRTIVFKQLRAAVGSVMGTRPVEEATAVDFALIHGGRV